MNDFENTDLPVGWVNIAVGDAVISISTNGKKIRQKEYAEQGRYAVVDQGQEHIGGYTDDKEKLVDCQLPVIVFGDHTRVIKYVKRPFAAGADGTKVLQPHEFITPKYFEYCLRHFSESMTSMGYARHYQHLAKALIPLPPLPEQHRIVAKIEELFSELDKGIESLKTAREQLKVYRQALLKYAFEGKLTEKWREENAGAGSKPALDADVKGGRVTDRAPTKRRKDLPPLTAEELADLPELPQGWGWVKLGNTDAKISDGPFGSNLKTSDYVAKGVRVVRLENVGVLEFIENRETYITEEKYDLLKRHTVTAGDIIFSSFILENIRVALIPPSITKAINKADCFCVRLSGETLFNSYAVMFLSSRHVYKQLEALVHGIGRPRINTTQLKEVVIPVCCIEEQKVIISELESRFSEIDQLDQTITTALQQSETLRQSIMKKAFSGKLVPQDPHDEPASVLLERIRAERSAPSTSAKPGRGRKKQETTHD